MAAKEPATLTSIGQSRIFLKYSNEVSRTTEENALYSCKGYQTLCKSRSLILDPSNRPIGFPLDGRYSIDAVEQVVFLFSISDISVYEKTVDFAVYVLHHDLEAVEHLDLADLHFSAEALDKIFVDDAIRRSEESQDM